MAEWAYRASRGGRCQVCGAVLTGPSRYWCREHTVHLGTIRLRVRPETVERMRAGRGAFEEPGRCVRVTVGDLRAAARAADLIEAMLVQESADAALQPPDWWEDVQRERERTMERLFAASGVPRDVLGVDETDAEG